MLINELVFQTEFVIFGNQKQQMEVEGREEETLDEREKSNQSDAGQIHRFVALSGLAIALFVYNLN